MTRNKTFYLLIAAGILVAGLGVFVQWLRYEPLYPGKTSSQESAALNIIPLFPDDPLLGFSRAPVTVVAFMDLGCPSCREDTRVFMKLIEKRPQKLRLVWKGLPTTRVPYSSDVALIHAWCAAKFGKFAEFLSAAIEQGDAILEDAVLRETRSSVGLQTAAFEQCLSGREATSAAERTAEIAKTAGIQRVPTIFINNKQIQPPSSVEEWETLLGLAK